MGCLRKYSERKIVAIIQARLTSTRFPNKILELIDGKPIIKMVVDNVSLSHFVDEVVVAAPHNIPVNLECPLFIGDEDDVLKRYYDAAQQFNADIIVRITADCPLVKSWHIDYLIHTFLIGNYDFVANTPGFPDGWDVEVFSFKVLEEAFKKAKLPEEREHVTPYIRNMGNRSLIINYTNSLQLGDIKISVDTQEDLENVRRQFELER